MAEHGADGTATQHPATAALHRVDEPAEIARLAADQLRSVCGGGAVVLTFDLGTERWDLAPVARLTPADRAEVGQVLAALTAGPPGASDRAPQPIESLAFTVVPVGGPGGTVAAYVLPVGADRETSCLSAAIELAEHHGLALASIQARRAVQRQLERAEEAAEQHRATSAALQRALLPPQLPVVDGLWAGATYRPLEHDIGGDFYDLFPLPDHTWGFVLGDVCGKGVDAASTTAMARNVTRTALLNSADPSRALATLNQLLVAERRERRAVLCTAVVGVVDTHEDEIRMELATAGHPPPIILRHDGSVEEVDEGGPILGVWDTIAVAPWQGALRPGDTCVMYTDGATDITDPRGELFGDERLIEVIEGCRGMHPEAIATSVERAVTSFQRSAARDDLAVLVLAAPQR